MATYIKGADTYLPDIKPFTPDYKFLSAVLETRTDKYDRNYKATNDLYNKVVYADLSREDTKNRRDQYAEQIAPNIEQISGLDLSLQSNVDAAKGVFAPFYEDDITVRDMVYTSRYRDQNRQAQNLLNSPDQTVQEGYWEVGKRAMQYQMDEFINADPDKAMNMRLPEYVPKANLFKMSQQLLENMDPPLKMKMDRFAKVANPNFNPNQDESKSNPKEIANTDWIITEQNGSLVTGAALQTIRASLIDNAGIQKAYQTEAYVKSMDWATQAVENGNAASLANGQELWASETIRRIETVNQYKLNKDFKALEKAEKAAVTWANYKGGNGLVPGSQLDQLDKEQLSDIEKYKLDIEAKKRIANEAALPSPTNQNLLNKAYSLYMQSNIMNDMQESAQTWSARDYIYEMNPNEFAVAEKKFKYNMAEISARSTNAFNLAKFNADRKDNNTMLDKGYQYDAEGNLIKLPWAEGMGLGNGGLGSFLNQPNPTIGDANTMEGATVNGEFSVNSDIIETAKADHGLHMQNVGKEQISMLLGSTGQLGMLQILDPRGNTGDDNQKFSINLGGKEVVGTLNELKKELMLPKNDDGTGGLKYLNEIKTLYTEQQTRFNDTRQVTKDNIEATQGNQNQRTQYDDLYDAMSGPNGTNVKMKAGDVFIQEAYKTYKEAYDQNRILKSAREDSDIKGFMDAGMPDLFEEGSNMPYSKEEYIQRVLEGVKNGEIKNYDEWGWDVGTDREDYLIPKMEMIPGTQGMGGGGASPTTGIPTGGGASLYRQVLDADGEVVMVPDERAVAAEAGQVYDALKTNLNAALTDQKDANTNSASFNSIKYGIKGGYADVISNFTYNYNINPLSRDADSENEVINLVAQIRDMDSKGLPYGIGVGKLGNKAELTEKDAFAVKVYNELMKDLQTWINNPKRSNTAAIAPIFSLAYKPVYGRGKEADKTHAGFEVGNMDAWLASKVKGGVNDDYGIFSRDDIKRLKGIGDDDGGSGIFIVFDQNYDLNPKAKKNDYYSSTEVDILSGENNGYADYKVPNDNGITPTAEFRIIKNGTGDYSVQYSVNTYNPKPTDPDLAANWKEYTQETGTVPMDFRQGLRGIDIQVQNYLFEYKQTRATNQRLRQKDEAINK